MENLSNYVFLVFKIGNSKAIQRDFQNGKTDMRCILSPYFVKRQSDTDICPNLICKISVGICMEVSKQFKRYPSIDIWIDHLILSVLTKLCASPENT